MKRYESFGECLKRCLKEGALSASEAARLVGFRSRNSMFRILSGEASPEAKQHLLEALQEALGDAWPQERWMALQEALSVERLGAKQYEANRAFSRVLREGADEVNDYTAVQILPDGRVEVPLRQLIEETVRYPRAEIIITDCCDRGIAALLADTCGEAGEKGKLTVRHYIDTAQDVVCSNILGVLPLISKPWYNARLVGEESCPPEMMAIYRLKCIHILRWDDEGRPSWTICVRYDQTHFTLQDWREGLCPAVMVADQWRFQLELLKPMKKAESGPEMFVEYTHNYLQLEENCAIFSVKPDVHFNCIPVEVLEQSVIEGFEQSGIAAGPELVALIEVLKAVHEQRFRSITTKHKPTHLVYSLPMMERFMRTGVLSDQFFIQRAYTVEERRLLIRVLLDAMRENPYFHVHFIRKGVPPFRYEMTSYGGKGVLLLDAYTSYELDADHSEALITLPAFMEGFERYFKDELLANHVISRGETLRELERLLVMNVQE